MTYPEALDYIAALAPRGWRLGLDRMAEFARRAGLSDALGPDAPAFVHVAGTNGKGSTTAYVQSLLHESGYRVGAFFSPYVYDPRERIQLGRELIPETIFAGLATLLEPIAEEFTETEFGGISEFEFKTAMALMFYKRLRCEWVALEVGLGGRLDATNIVTPRVGVIVSIGLDHTNILGGTLAEIAHEKAGIIKPGVPVVVGHMPPEALTVIEREAADKGAEIWRYGIEISLERAARDGSLVVTTPRGRHAGLNLGIEGAMQEHNLALAVAACDAAGATRTLGGLQRGSALARIPGRFEIRKVGGKTFILDGAHNPDAADVLAQSLESLRLGSIHLLTGMVEGHDPSAFYARIWPLVEAATVVPVGVPRTLDPNLIAKGLQTAEVAIDAEAGLERALAAIQDVVLVTGSFYLVGEVGRLLDAR